HLCPFSLHAALPIFPLRKFSPHFFVLGTAFMLLETRSLVAFGLLFGNTWVVNSLVFFAILSSVLGAIALSSRLRLERSPLYLALDRKSTRLNSSHEW